MLHCFRSLVSKLIVLAFSLSFVACDSNKIESSDALSALPIRSAMVFKVNDAEDLSIDWSRNAIVAELDTLTLIKDFKSWISYLPESLAEHVIWGAVNTSGANTYDVLVATELKDQLVLPDTLEWTSQEYANTIIYSAQQGELTWNICSYRQVLLLSKSKRLVEGAIRQLDTEHTLEADEDFMKALRTTNSKDDLNLIINYGEIAGWLESVFPNAPLNFIGNMGTWAAYDLATEVDQFMLNGVHLNPDSANSWLSCFVGVRPGDFDAQEILPTNTAQAVMINVGSFVEYNRKYQEYLRKGDRLRLFSTQIEQLEYDIDEVLHSWGGEEFGLISLETSLDAVAQPRIAYIRTRDAELAIESLAPQNNPDFIENHRGYIIRQSNTKNLLLLGYGRIFKDMVSPFYAVHGDYVVFGNNLLTLKGYLNDLMDGRTLTGQSAFNDAIDEIPSTGHVRVIHKNPGALGLLRRLIDSEETDIIDDNFDAMSKVAWTFAQYRVDGEASYSQFFVKHQEKYIPEAKQLWALTLRGEVVGTPQFVVNHYTKKNELLVQDEANILYLIDHSGEVLWQRELDGPILGKVTQVDLFRNDKLQLAFNTERFIYIIDRNGNDVSPFPVALPKPSTAPMAVFDYDRARNYRFVIPCGNDLLNYSKEGKQVDGWVFETTQSPILRQPQHFTVGTRDFIVAREENGLVHLVNRRGETRIPVEDRLPDTHNDLYLSIGSNTEDTRIITLGEDGELLSLYMNGTVESNDINLANDPGEFLFADGRYIISQNGRFYVKDELHPFERDLDADLSKPFFFIKNEAPIYGVVAQNLDQVWLFGATGEPLPGLPLYGSSDFTVGEFGQRGVLNLVVGTSDGHLLNYKLE